MLGDRALPVEETLTWSMVGDPCPSNGGIDFFQKSLGDPCPTSGGDIDVVNGR